MALTRLLRYAGWSANVSATAAIITFMTAILFFSIGQPFGTLNDIASVFQVLFMLPLTLVLYRLSSSNARMLNIVGVLLGIVGMPPSLLGRAFLFSAR